LAWRLKEVGALQSGLSPADIAAAMSLPLWVAIILHHRMKHWGDQSLEAVKRFLEPSLKNLPDPFSLPDMDQGADRLAEAIVEGQKIGIFGDYDVDGTVGSALLRRFLRSLGNEPEVYQPDRQKEGYGINGGAIEKLAEMGVQLLIAVDCGITSVKEVELANSLGIDVIICDHHEPKGALPPAYAVLDHKRADNESSIRSLSGAGVAFYLAIATRSVLRDIGHFDAEGGGAKEPDVKDLLDLVALATVADMVPLVDENRILLKAGLDKLRRSPSVGLRELLRVAGVKPEEVTTYHLGFLLGPRINASGRLGSANGALELLSTEDPAEAKRLAEHLDGVNQERMRVQGEVAADALAQAGEQVEQRGKDLPAIVVFGEDWHEGVIGIVASKVVEKFQRPVAVITHSTHTGLGKGSVRGFGALDMTAALDSCAELLKSFGGHKAAAGLSIPREHAEAFRQAFADAVGAQAEALTGGASKLLSREVVADVRLAEAELNPKVVELLDKLAPFGMGNSEPVILISGGKVASMRTLKERHLKVQFTFPQDRSLEGFWANGVGKLEEGETGEVEIIGLPQINNFRNLNRLELKIKDLRVCSH
jgi:single-stranded-DNA-specific exonuclease